MQRSSADLPLLVDLWIDTRIRLLLYSRDKPVPLSALVRENKVTKHKIRHDYKNPSGVPGEDLRSGTLVETVQLKAFLSMFRHLQTIQYVTPGWPRNTTSVFPLYLLLSRTGTVPLVPTHTHKWFSATSGLHASHHQLSSLNLRQITTSLSSSSPPTLFLSLHQGPIHYTVTLLLPLPLPDLSTSLERTERTRKGARTGMRLSGTRNRAPPHLQSHTRSTRKYRSLFVYEQHIFRQPLFPWMCKEYWEHLVHLLVSYPNPCVCDFCIASWSPCTVCVSVSVCGSKHRQATCTEKGTLSTCTLRNPVCAGDNVL